MLIIRNIRFFFVVLPPTLNLFEIQSKWKLQYQPTYTLLDYGFLLKNWFINTSSSINLQCFFFFSFKISIYRVWPHIKCNISSTFWTIIIISIIDFYLINYIVRRHIDEKVMRKKYSLHNENYVTCMCVTCMR